MPSMVTFDAFTCTAIYEVLAVIVTLDAPLTDFSVIDFVMLSPIPDPVSTMG